MRPALAVVVAVLVGTAVGLGGYTFVYAKGYSYLLNDPSACANCHVMNDHFSAWMKSSHRPVAGCNDCHTPHDPLRKYVVKAQNGFWHSFYFTTGNYPYPIRITEPNHEVVEGACRDCHERITETIDHVPAPPTAAALDRQPLSCVHCHRHVGHWLR